MKVFDYSEYKDILWDNEIVGLVSKIHEYKGRQEIYLNHKPIVLDKLVEIAKIQSMEYSNKIEGIVTTDKRIRELVLDNTKPISRDEEEIMGYRDVLNTIHENYEFITIKSSFILQLHRDLYKYSYKEIGGKYKNVDNVITEVQIDGSKKIRFMPLSPHETPNTIEEICINYNRIIDIFGIDELILIPIFILDFLCIHPFNDGNGRMSRLLTTLLLYRSGYVVGKYISLEKIIEKNKDIYYDALHVSGVNWHENENNPIPFIKFFLSCLLQSYKEFEQRVDIFNDKVSALDHVRNLASNRIGKFTKSDIIEVAPTLSKSSVENAIKSLVDEGVLEKHGKGKNTFYVMIGDDC